MMAQARTGRDVIGATFCSGIGAPEVAAPWVDWRLASEIEAFPRSVLHARHGYRMPADHNQGDPLLWGDMTEVTPDLLRRHGIPLPDLIVAGTPCQAFSVAGPRRGTEDPRGNLTLAFVEILHAIVDARPDGRLAGVWENVPGVLSDKRNAFGCFLGGIVGADDAIPSPGGGSWPGVGLVSGPRARVAWRVLNAQYFGVAQRRRRVFVVIDFGEVIDPASVLFEPKSLRGDPATRQTPAPGAVAGALRSTGGGCDVDHALAGHLIASTGDIAHCLNAGGMGRIDYETETMVATAHGVRKLLPVECERLQGFPDGFTNVTHRGKPAADGPRYKALGNSMAVPVMRWILDRVRQQMKPDSEEGCR